MGDAPSAAAMRIFVLGLAVLVLDACQFFERETHPDEFAGIGVELELPAGTKHPTIRQAFSGGPAHAAGLKPGDAILAAGGVSTESKSIMDVVQLLRGRPETEVVLDIRAADGSIRKVTVRRRIFTRTESGESGYNVRGK
ncbi:MAG: hypothetical protein GMKNLPBB_02785 [Myxococcota bacterium]|nr:hypothetical protein [Myxococcota bacterium]